MFMCRPVTLGGASPPPSPPPIKQKQDTSYLGLGSQALGHRSGDLSKVTAAKGHRPSHPLHFAKK